MGGHFPHSMKLMDDPMLRISGLSKSFGAIQALDKVDLEIAKGRIHGIIGPNGSGKTTLFNCITGHLKPDAGSIHLEAGEITGPAARCHRQPGHPPHLPGGQARARHDRDGERHGRG